MASILWFYGDSYPYWWIWAFIGLLFRYLVKSRVMDFSIDNALFFRKKYVKIACLAAFHSFHSTYKMCYFNFSYLEISKFHPY